MERAFYQLLNQEGNVDNDATDHLTATDHRETIVHLNDPITTEELRKAVKAANNGKAPGLDGIPAEVIKHCGDGLLQQLISVKCTRSNCLRRSKAGLTAHLKTCNTQHRR